MIGFFITKMRSKVYFSYKNAFHIKGVIILGKGIVVRHHRKCKKFGVALPLPLIGATGPTGNSGPIGPTGGHEGPVGPYRGDWTDGATGPQGPQGIREYKVPEGQQEHKEYKELLVIQESKV